MAGIEVALIEPNLLQDPGPYKFLDYFEEADEPKFMGRAHDTRELVARIVVDRTVALYGRSGLGKTSLILAGVFPILRSRGFDPIQCRVLDNPTVDIMLKISEATGIDGTEDRDEFFKQLESYERIPRPLVIVLDQFEEFFIRFFKESETRLRFIDFLRKILSVAALDARVVISIREDYLSRLDEIREELPGLFVSEYRLRPLTAFGARQAITRPLQDAGIEYDPRVVSRLMDLLAVEDFDSLLLQIMCTAITTQTRRSGHPNHIQESDLDEIGGIEGILSRFLADATQNLPAEYRLLSRTVLDAMVTSDNTKRAVTIGHLMEWDFFSSEEELNNTLSLLQARRLVRRELRGQQTWFELTHERLVTPILHWFLADKTFSDYRFAREFITNMARNTLFRERNETLAPKSSIETLIGPFRERLKCTSTEVEYLVRSCVYSQTEDDLVFWEHIYGTPGTTQILREFMVSTDAAARTGAAWAVAALKSSDCQLEEGCLRLALSDSVESVRNSASSAIARLGGRDQFEALRKALRSKEQRRNAEFVLSELVLQDRKLTGIPLLARLKARRIADRRLLNGRFAERTKSRNAGLVGLLSSAAVWIFFPGTIILSIILWLAGDTGIWPIISSAEAMVALGVVAIPGAFNSYLILIGHTRRQILRRGLVREVVLAAMAAALLFGLGAIFLKELSEEVDSRTYFFLALNAIGLAAISTVSARVVARQLQQPAVRMKIWLWLECLGISTGLPLLAGAVAAWMISHNNENSKFVPVCFADGAIWSVTMLTGAVALAYASAASNEDGRTHPTGRGKRLGAVLVGIAGVVCCSALAIWYVEVMGLHSLRPFPIKMQLGDSKVLFSPLPSLDSYSKWRTTYFYKLVSTADKYYHFVSSGYSVQSNDKYYASNDVIAAKTGYSILSLHNRSWRLDEDPLGNEVSGASLEPIAEIGSAPSEISNSEWELHAVRFKKIGDSWIASFAIAQHAHDPNDLLFGFQPAKENRFSVHQRIACALMDLSDMNSNDADRFFSKIAMPVAFSDRSGGNSEFDVLWRNGRSRAPNSGLIKGSPHGYEDESQNLTILELIPQKGDPTKFVLQLTPHRGTDWMGRGSGYEIVGADKLPKEFIVVAYMHTVTPAQKPDPAVENNSAAIHPSEGVR